MPTRPFPTDPRLTAIAIAYRNPDVALIADDVLPRTPVAWKFKWLEYDLAQGFTVPDTRVGRKSLPNQVEFSSIERTDSVADYGLDDLVPNEDIEADNQGVDPLGTSTQYTTGLLNLGREVRVAAAVFNTANHTNTLTLSGTDQWDNDASNPVISIGDALDTPIVRPNIAVLGQTVWTKLRRNKLLVQAIKGTAQGAGMISRQEFADFFELQQLLVGAGFVNTAKKGQAATLSRVWGKHAAFLYRDRSAGPQAGMTYGFTGEFGTRIAGQMPAPEYGLTGSVRVRSGERVKEVIAAKDLSFYFQNAVS